MKGTLNCSLDWCVPEDGRRDSCPEWGIGFWDKEWLREILVSSSWKDRDWTVLEKYTFLVAAESTEWSPDNSTRFLKWLSFIQEIHFRIVTVQLLGGSRTDQLLEMASETKATNVTSLQHCAPGRALGGALGWGSTCQVVGQVSYGELREEPVEKKGKSSLDHDFQYKCRPWKQGLTILLTSWVLPKTPNIPNYI